MQKSGKESFKLNLISCSANNLHKNALQNHTEAHQHLSNSRMRPDYSIKHAIYPSKTQGRGFKKPSRFSEDLIKSIVSEEEQLGEMVRRVKRMSLGERKNRESVEQEYRFKAEKHIKLNKSVSSHPRQQQTNKSQVLELRTQVNSLKLELEQEKARVEQISSDLQQQRQQRQLLLQELKVVDSISSLQHKNQKFQTQIKQTANQRLKKKCQALQARNQALETEVQRLKALLKTVPLIEDSRSQQYEEEETAFVQEDKRENQLSNLAFETNPFKSQTKLIFGIDSSGSSSQEIRSVTSLRRTISPQKSITALPVAPEPASNRVKTQISGEKHCRYRSMAESNENTNSINMPFSNQPREK